MTALQVKDITKSFGAVQAVDHVSFTVERGEVFGFIGPNGAGKTTSMRICATLDLPDSGDVFVDGRSALAEPREVRQRLGFMPDFYGAYPNTTVQEYLDFFARAYGKKGRERRRILDEVTEFTNLDGLRQQEMTALSKGMKQRLCLAKTLLHDPACMILDEPAAGLDPRARVEFRELVKALAERGKAILISSHILTELSEICDGVAVIERGLIRATGSVADIKRKLRPHRMIRVKTLDPPADLERLLAEQPRVARMRAGKDFVEFDYDGQDPDVAALLETLVRNNVRVVEFKSSEVDLEEVFLKLTEGAVQ